MALLWVDAVMCLGWNGVDDDLEFEKNVHVLLCVSATDGEKKKGKGGANCLWVGSGNAKGSEKRCLC